MPTYHVLKELPKGQQPGDLVELNADEAAVFLAVGAVIANLIGTTGASMVLVRPWIRMNKVRASAYHVVFFIFLVSNVGGSLTPIGDPPLFLGYLRGVPFFWLAQHVLGPWFAAVGLILAAFYVLDRRSFHRMPARLQGKRPGLRQPSAVSALAAPPPRGRG